MSTPLSVEGDLRTLCSVHHVCCSRSRKSHEVTSKDQPNKVPQLRYQHTAVLSPSQSPSRSSRLVERHSYKRRVLEPRGPRSGRGLTCSRRNINNTTKNTLHQPRKPINGSIADWQKTEIDQNARLAVIRINRIGVQRFFESFGDKDRTWRKPRLVYKSVSLSGSFSECETFGLTLGML